MFVFVFNGSLATHLYPDAGAFFHFAGVVFFNRDRVYCKIVKVFEILKRSEEMAV